MLKRILLSLLCALPIIASAQSLHLMIEGGAMWNTKTSNPTTLEHSSTIGGTGSMGVSYQKNRLDIGLMFGYRHYALRQEGDVIMEPYFNPSTGYSTYEHVKFTETMPALYISPFVNLHFRKRKLDWYTGVAPVFLRFFSPRYTDGSGTIRRNLEDGDNAYGLDLRAGCNIPLSGSIAFFTEASGGMVFMPNNFKEAAIMFSTALNLGFRLEIE